VEGSDKMCLEMFEMSNHEKTNGKTIIVETKNATKLVNNGSEKYQKFSNDIDHKV
jgi:hypothetical protein